MVVFVELFEIFFVVVDFVEVVFKRLLYFEKGIFLYKKIFFMIFVNYILLFILR